MLSSQAKLLGYPLSQWDNHKIYIKGKDGTWMWWKEFFQSQNFRFQLWGYWWSTPNLKICTFIHFKYSLSKYAYFLWYICIFVLNNSLRPKLSVSILIPLFTYYSNLEENKSLYKNFSSSIKNLLSTHVLEKSFLWYSD